MDGTRRLRAAVRRRKGWIAAVAALLLLAGGISAAVALSGTNGPGGRSANSAGSPSQGQTRPYWPRPRTAAGWPDATTTGVPRGVQLSSMDHGLTVTTPGTHLDGLEIHGDVIIAANDVSITDSRILGHLSIPLTHEDVHGVRISDVELDGRRQGDPDKAEPGITTYGGMSCIRCNVHGFNMGIAIDGEQPTLIQDSWVHDMWPPSPGHKDAVITNGSRNATIEHNRLSCEVSGCSAAIGLFGDFAPVSRWVVKDNLLNGGSYCSYSGSIPGKPHPVASDITWIGNHYGRDVHAECGIYGPAAGWTSGNGNTWTGNVWDGDGTHGARSVRVPEPDS